MIIERDRLPDVGVLEHCDFAWSATPPAVQRGPSYVPADGRVEVLWSPLGIVVGGHVTRPVIVQPDWEGPIHGVQLKLGRAAAVLGADPDLLVAQHTWLSDLWGREGGLLHERVAAQASAREAVAELVRGLDRNARAPTPDPVIDLVAARARRPGGSVAAMAEEAGYSERQLRRRFTRAAGFGPKMLQRIERLQRFIRAPAGDLARAAAELGYSDESHLGRDARELAGASPATLLAQRG